MGGFRIDFDGVGKAYGGQSVLEGVSLSVVPGEALGLLGPNGAGKTTMFKLILGLIRADSGGVKVDGIEPATQDYREKRASIGFLPENVTFDGGLSGRAMLSFYGRLKSVAENECDDLLREVGLENAKSRPVRTYSKGMRQRLGLAQALLGSPRLLLLDEPTTGLDPASRRQFFSILDQQRARGVSVLMSSHALAEMETHMDRFAILANGKLRACGSLEDLKQRAGMQTQVRLTVPKGRAQSVAKHFDGRVQLSYVNEKHVDLSCLASDKMLVMRELANLKGEVQDVELRTPRLDDIYAHFANDGARS